MFNRRLTSLALALSLASLAAAAPSFAQTACSPEKLNASLDQFAREVVSGLGSTYQHPPANFYRALREPLAAVARG